MMDKYDKQIKDLDKQIELLKKEREAALLKQEIEKIRKTKIEETVIYQEHVIYQEQKIINIPSYPTPLSRWGNPIWCASTGGPTATMTIRAL